MPERSGRSGRERWDGLWSAAREIVVDDLDREIWRNLSAHVTFGGRSMLELGCGRGIQSRFAAEAGASAVTLLDSSAAALSVARQVFAGVGQAEFVQQDLLSYRAGRRFDVVISSGTVEHFRGEELLQCLRVHRDHAREVVAIVVPTTPHPNAFQCRRRRFVEAYGYERPISARRMQGLLRAVKLRPLVLRRFFPLYNVRAYWFAPRTGLRRLDRRLARLAVELDQSVQRRVVGRLMPSLRRLDRSFGGLLLAVAAPQRRESA
jgi:SAM-dependent methyltransferase